MDLDPGGVWGFTDIFSAEFFGGNGLFCHFGVFTYIKRSPERAKIPLNMTLEGLKSPPEVRVEHKTCSTICGTPVQAILDEIFLTRLAGGVREGQNMAQNAPYAIKKMA